MTPNRLKTTVLQDADYAPSQLPAITRVEIVVINQSQARLGNLETMAADARAEDQTAQEIATLWRRLPPGEQKRCHIPPFALRFYVGAKLLLTASICWMCHNIWIHQDGGRITYEFDADVGVSQELLTRCRELTGHFSASEEE